MTRVRIRGETVRHFILRHVEKHPNDISRLTSDHFKISRQAVNKHLQKLITERSLVVKGQTRNRSYKLVPESDWRKSYQIVPGLAEDVVWRNDIASVIGELPQNVLDIWHHGFTEIFNNAIDHSEGSKIYVAVKKMASRTEMIILDDGVGIFKKIQTKLNLLDERHAVFELKKGKLTTDPQKHTGEGIFFTSRMFDSFDILSGGVFFTHSFGDPEDWVLESKKMKSGTMVWMKLDNHTARTVKKVLTEFASSADDYRFSKTVVPVQLALYGNDKLISRSQAKRVLARVELFNVVVFDFKGVPTIGQAFADEIFRVFANEHPEIKLQVAHSNSEIDRIIRKVKSSSGKKT